MNIVKKEPKHCCILNVGHYRSGTTTLAIAAGRLGLNASRRYDDIPDHGLKDILLQPEKYVQEWYTANQEDAWGTILDLACTHDLLCDGLLPLLPFLPLSTLQELQGLGKARGIDIVFVATIRDVQSIVRSELQHWIVHNLESRAKLTATERQNLEDGIRERATKHWQRIQDLSKALHINLLPLGPENWYDEWAKSLSYVSAFTINQWSDALRQTGITNANPPLPVEGILLTFRLGARTESTNLMVGVEKLLGQLEQDSLCRYLIVLALDEDEANGAEALHLVQRLKQRLKDKPQLQSLHVITNPPRLTGQPFPICSIWNQMAEIAWKNGAAWVVLLGDDITIQCSFHYRAIYRTFLDIKKALKLSIDFFGCPWWNDTTFPGFPSFPCVGRIHYDIFGSLIPQHRQSNFVNQDLDPYLQQLYLKFHAAPCIRDAKLSNGHGGCGQARYQRIHALAWQDFVAQDRESIGLFLPKETRKAILVDVVVPSYRVQVDYLRSICSLRVPEYMQTLFIIIVDNQDALIHAATTIKGQNGNDFSVEQSERILEEYLSRESGNTVRVRTNEVNVGASASRNRGLDRSAAEFILNLDDDLVPDPDLLEQYGSKLKGIDPSVIGLIGLVRFPRSRSLPLRHAAVLMSYLTFMFEISDSNLYPNPAWGVTANILFRRTSVRFDLAYAKTGGGEDVDYALRVTEACPGGKLIPVPTARVVHPFWPGSVWTLSSHFFNWAVGDSGLLKRFPKYRYWSFPNLPETTLLLSPLWIWMQVSPWKIIQLLLSFLLADFVVDISNRQEYRHRCQLLHVDLESCPPKWKPRFYFQAHMLANLYVVILEFGRLYGHLSRMEPWHGMLQRFDWHCGRLPKAPHNFRKREACKFVLFMIFVEIHLGWFGSLVNLQYHGMDFLGYFARDSETCPSDV